jgi:peptide chain release factor 1
LEVPLSLERYIADAKIRLHEAEQAISSFDFQRRPPQEYEKLNRDHRYLAKLCRSWDELRKAEADLAENQAMLASETDPEFLAVIQHDIEELEKRRHLLDRDVKTLVLPPHPAEGRPVIVEIRPAAGGDEAALFAGDLFRMYIRFAELKRWKMEILDQVASDLGGIKSVVFSLQGEDAFGLMSLESGVHRVQRVPTTETQGRIHTSTVTVAVLPEALEVDIKIEPNDLRIDVFRSSGAGGQSVNRTDSAVRVTHLPTGISIASQQERSQHRNREIVMRLLRAKLLEIKQDAEDAKNAATRRQQVGTGDRSERIRTYNFPQNRVTDHRFGISRHDLTLLLEGNIGDFLQDIRAAAANQRLNNELGEAIAAAARLDE